MKLTDEQYTYSSLSIIAAGAHTTTLALPSRSDFAVEKDAHKGLAELRIKDRPAKLKITSAQEGQ